jgi:hypothetical protein
VFTVVYNEHVFNSDGSLTVNAAHMYLFGRIAVGEAIKGQVRCGVSPNTTSASDTRAPTCEAAVPEFSDPSSQRLTEPRRELVGVFDSGVPSSRSVADGVTTNGSTTVTSATANFDPADVGASISGAGLAGNARIASVTDAATAVMTVPASASATGVALTVTRGNGLQSITNVQATNAVVEIGDDRRAIDSGWRFTPGQTGPLPMQAQRIDDTLPMSWSFDATDAAGNTTVRVVPVRFTNSRR